MTLRTSLNAMRKVRRLRAREADLDEASHHAHPVGAIDPDLRDALALAIAIAWAWTRYGRAVNLARFFRVTSWFMASSKKTKNFLKNGGGYNLLAYIRCKISRNLKIEV